MFRREIDEIEETTRFRWFKGDEEYFPAEVTRVDALPQFITGATLMPLKPNSPRHLVLHGGTESHGFEHLAVAYRKVMSPACLVIVGGEMDSAWEQKLVTGGTCRITPGLLEQALMALAQHEEVTCAIVLGLETIDAELAELIFPRFRNSGYCGKPLRLVALVDSGKRTKVSWDNLIYVEERRLGWLNLDDQRHLTEHHKIKLTEDDLLRLNTEYGGDLFITDYCLRIAGKAGFDSAVTWVYDNRPAVCSEWVAQSRELLASGVVQRSNLKALFEGATTVDFKPHLVELYRTGWLTKTRKGKKSLEWGISEFRGA